MIVTNVGDSIACKVIEQTKEFVQFSYNRYNHDIIKKLRSDHVKSVTLNFYVRMDSLSKPIANTTSADTLIQIKQEENQIVDSDTNIRITAGDLIEPELSKWQFSVNGGYAYRLFKPQIRSTPYERDYIDKLKSGYSLNADVFYFPWKKIGFGLKYDRFQSKGERDIRTKDDITIQFIGASVAHKLVFQNERTSVITAFWMGYQPYKNKFMFVGQDYTSKAQTMGWGVSVGLDYKITRNLALNFAASCFMGTIYKYEQELKGSSRTIHLARNRFEDLSRAAFTVGLKFLK